MSEIKETQVYTREEAEKLLKISRSSMMRLIKKGVIRAAKIGGQYRILGAELLRQFLPESGYVAVRDVYRESRKVVHSLEAELKEEEKEEIECSTISPFSSPAVPARSARSTSRR